MSFLLSLFWDSNYYLKIKRRNTTITFFYPYDGNYYQCNITIAENFSENKLETKSYSEYYNYPGDWYQFNGNYKDLHSYLRKYQPSKNSPPTILFEYLECALDLKLYQSTLYIICNWAYEATKLLFHTPLNTILGVSMLGIGYWLNGQKTIEDKK